MDVHNEVIKLLFLKVLSQLSNCAQEISPAMSKAQVI